jgi:hypothetical protein
MKNEPSDATIQYQDASGNWIPCATVPNQSPLIIQGMKRAAQYYADTRIRAVDPDGRLIDIL